MPRTLASLTAGVLLVSLSAVAPAALADHTDPPTSVALVGSLQDEMGCSADWQPDCADPDSEMDLVDGRWQTTVRLPAGDYAWKVAVDDSWDESYGAGGGDMVLPLEQATTLRFTYDPGTHRLAVRDARPARDAGAADRDLAADSLRDALTRERLYFVMADRFANGDRANDSAGLGQDPLVSGYDPRRTGFYHGGDLDGVIDRLDYIEDLGTTAIWLTPSFKNKPVQGATGEEAAGYHGYWITDFTRIDPHLGTNRDMARLVDLAHDRGIKVFFDIITNHTADVIDYDRSQYTPSGELPYVSTEEEPYRDASGEEFDDRDHADGSQPFPEVDEESFPYAPRVPRGEEDVKVPAWLNDPTLYHNRGTSTFSGESNTYGDFPSGAFSALDDLWTEHPRVVDGMTEVYEKWITDVGIDGFRIDTVKHVNMEFWQQFAPSLVDHAASVGQDDFFMFGEVYDASSEFVSQYTTEGRLQAAVDFGFQGSAASFANGGRTSSLAAFYAQDDWYTDADSNAYQLPTFLGNHDMGRIGSFLRQGGDSEASLLRRDKLAHTLMYLTRGQPVVYYGDEQGFSAPPDVPDGIGDQRAREDMFPSKVGLYNSYDLIGTDATTARSNFDRDHPLYRRIARLATLREKHRALADGAQVQRYAEDGAGVFAVSRVNARNGREALVAVNNSPRTRRVTVDTFTPRTAFRRLWSSTRTPVPGTVRTRSGGRTELKVPAYGAVVYRARRPIPADGSRPEVELTSPVPDADVHGRTEVAVEVDSASFNQVTVAWRQVGGTSWRPLGTDDNPPFRVFHDVRDLPVGTAVEYRAVARDADGSIDVDQTSAMVGSPAPPAGPDWGGPVVQPSVVSVAGSHNSETGCPADWMPKCEAARLALDEEDGVWSATFGGDGGRPALPRGGYAYKVAVDPQLDDGEGWAENYGANAVRDGENIELRADGGPVSLYYSRATNWVTDSIATPHLYTAVGDFQSELGCGSDGDPACLRSWLQDPDGDGTWVLRSHTLPAGSYSFRVAQDQTTAGGTWGEGGDPAGGEVSFTVAEGEGVEITFRPNADSDPGTPAAALSVETYEAPAPTPAP